MKFKYSNGVEFKIDLGDDLTPLDDLVFALSFHIVSVFNHNLDVPIKRARTVVLIDEIKEFINQKIDEYKTV